MVASKSRKNLPNVNYHWHAHCLYIAAQGSLVASPKGFLEKAQAFFLPSDPPAQGARGMADCESRPHPVPPLLYRVLFRQSGKFRSAGSLGVRECAQRSNDAICICLGNDEDRAVL